MSGLTLILNAAEGRLQIVLIRADGGILCSQDWDAPSRGTELFTPILSALQKSCSLSFADITRIACVTGPGSFTGLRLILTTAAALRRVTGAVLAGLPYLQALAASLPFTALCPAQPAYRIRVLTHARRQLVHGQDFEIRPSARLPLPVTELALLNLETAFASAEGLRFILGSGVARNQSFWSEQKRNAFSLEPFFLTGIGESPSPEALVRLTWELPESAWSARDLDPIYLRPCDAVDNLPSIAARRGQDPEEAQAQLHDLLNTALTV